MTSNNPSEAKPEQEFHNSNVIPVIKQIVLNKPAVAKKIEDKFKSKNQRGQDNGQSPKNINPTTVNNNNGDRAQKPNLQGKHKPHEKQPGDVKPSKKSKFSLGLSGKKDKEQNTGLDKPNTRAPVPLAKDPVPLPVQKLNIQQSSDLSISNPNEKNSGSQSNTAPQSPPPLSSPQVTPKPNTIEFQLPQQYEEKQNEKEKKLLDIYEKMLGTIGEFKASQDNKKAEIETTKKSIEQLRHEKTKHATEIKELQVELYDLLKQVKVTDDDLSTIQKKLAALSGKLSNFPPNSKKSFNKKGHSRDDVLKFFQKCWIDQIFATPDDKEKTIQSITNLFNQQQEIDYALVSVLVEKLVMDYFVIYIFKQPIYLDFEEINESYSTIQNIFKPKHPEWVSNLRLKCVKATLNEIDDGGKAAEMSKASRKRICDLLLEKLSAIYDREEIASRIKKLVEMAADLSFPMNSQEETIERKFLLPGDDFFTNQVKAQYGSEKSSTKVKLGISPVFLVKNSVNLEEIEDEDDHYIDDEEDEQEDDDGDKPNHGYYEPYKKEYTLVYSGRAIGYSGESKQGRDQTKTEYIQKPDTTK